MRWSQTFIPTTREIPAEAESPGHRLLIRAGCIRSLGAGLYTYLPLGLKILRNIERIIREEMEKANARELLMPILQPEELWRKSGRFGSLDLGMLTVKNRADRQFVLAPTHEEVITDLAAREIKSYKDLPRNFYQIQAKFRDELRPRFGLIRAKEFIMKDGYSFDRDNEASLATYKKMEEAYRKIFSRCGLKIEEVLADPGAMGGGMTHEFMAPAEIGEDTIVRCESCGYASNLETAVRGEHSEPGREAPLGKKEVDTPGIRTVEELTRFLNTGPEKLIKTLIYEIDGDPAAVLVRGDREVNELKLKRLTKAAEINMAGEELVQKTTGAPAGFAGPCGLKGIKIIADNTVQGVVNAVSGANKPDKHLINLVPGRDFSPDATADISYIRGGDPCPECGDSLKVRKGIEVGQVFNLGLKYSRALNASFLDSDGREKHCVMGCYGIGVSRTMSAAVEQNHDDDGIIWPREISPFEALILPVNLNDEKTLKISGTVYGELKSSGIEVLFDDRDLRAGVKFKDADLIGIPSRITIGPRNAARDMVEIYDRKTRETSDIKAQDAAKTILKIQKTA